MTKFESLKDLTFEDRTTVLGTLFRAFDDGFGRTITPTVAQLEQAQNSLPDRLKNVFLKAMGEYLTYAPKGNDRQTQSRLHGQASPHDQA